MIVTWGFTPGREKLPFKPPRSPGATGKSDPFFCKTAQKIYLYDSVRMIHNRPTAKA